MNKIQPGLEFRI